MKIKDKLDDLQPNQTIVKNKRPKKNLVGMIFGKLTVTDYAGALVFKNRRQQDHFWLCKCECGNTKNIRGRVLIKNITKTCGVCPKPKGNKHYAWQGCGELSKNIYNAHRHSAIAKGLAFEVTIEYMWSLFEKQNGKCVFTGWDIGFADTCQNQTNRTASLDRIDSTKGYIKGNLQWAHRDVNKLKKNIPNDRFIEICKAIGKYYAK